MKKQKRLKITDPLPPLPGFNQQQSDAIRSDAKTTVVIAGPGSGKTRTLIGRIEYLIDVLGRRPSEIVAITFTNAAASEMMKRLNEKRKVRLGFCGTLHGFMFRVLTKAKWFGESSIGIIDEERSKELLDSLIEKHRYRGTLNELETALKVGPAELLLAMRGHPTKAELLVSAYFRSLSESALVDFNTLIHYGAEAVTQLGDITDLLVDEFQDSSDKFAEIYMSIPVERRFFVGDPDQSIYSFLGGNVDNIIRLVTDGRTTTIRLEDNYRCGRLICEAAQKLIEHNDRVNKQTVSVSGKLGPVTVFTAKSEDEELRWIATQIRLNHYEDTAAVLVRTNALVQSVSQVLTGFGLTIRKKTAAAKPSDWPMVKSLLGALMNPYNDLLAEKFIRLFHAADKPKADGIISNAAKVCMSLNEYCLHLPCDLSPVAAVEFIRKKGATPESIELLEKGLSQLFEGAELSDFLLSIGESLHSREEIGSGITVTTYHGAKGREFPAVFLPAFEQNVIPIGTKTVNLQEERRLAYVGFTRAIDGLYISHSKFRKPPFKFEEIAMEPSQFIKEAGL